MNHGKKRLVTAGIACSVFFLCQNTMAAEQPVKYTATDFAMGTVISETVYTTGEDVTGIITGKLQEIEEDWISWREENSEIALINEASGGTGISENLTAYLLRAMELSEKSEGAMDLTIGKLIRLWDIDGENPQVPEEEKIQELLEECGYEKVHLTEEGDVTLDNGCTLDLGAVGKGIGCDEISKYLQTDSNIQGAIINLGGSSVMAYGSKPDQSDWQVAITDPRDPEGEYLGVVALKDGDFLSTSGDYEKYFIEDGVRYHHILNPKTGYPQQNGLASVTIICDSGLAADGLSTACFVLGFEESEKLLEEYDAEAIFVDAEKNIQVTEGLKERFTLLKESYEME